MMGSGKSTIGALLSKKLNRKFIDIDNKIEKIEKKLFHKFLDLRVKNILERLSLKQFYLY